MDELNGAGAHLGYAAAGGDILSLEGVARLLKIGERMVESLPIPYAKLGHRTKRFSRRQVVEWLEAQAH